MENQSLPFYNFRSCGYLIDRVTHICVSKLTIIGSCNGLSPGWRQAIIWTNAGTLVIGQWGNSFSEIRIEIHTFPFENAVRKTTVILSGSQCVKHWWLMAYICVSEQGLLWFSYWTVTYSAPSHYLKWCWLAVNWIHGNQIESQAIQCIKYTVNQMFAILLRGRWV